MDVKIEKHGEKEVKIALSGVNVRFANALRRAMIAEVPTLAIDEVNIYENNSLLYDEQLALRLALIPLRTNDLSAYTEEDRLSLSLKAESPERAGYTMVYSKDLISSDPKVEPAFDNVPIVKLISTEREISGIRTVVGQRLSFEAIAKLGRGREHAKWQPVTVCGLKELQNEDAKTGKKTLLLSIEGDGSRPVDEIVLEAARILREKCERVVEELSER
ncbi:MAG: DNA-directed RNA polymerase subunit D [Halobacteriota archaeon]